MTLQLNQNLFYEKQINDEDLAQKIVEIRNPIYQKQMELIYKFYDKKFLPEENRLTPEMVKAKYKSHLEEIKEYGIEGIDNFVLDKIMFQELGPAPEMLQKMWINTLESVASKECSLIKNDEELVMFNIIVNHKFSEYVNSEVYQFMIDRYEKVLEMEEKGLL